MGCFQRTAKFNLFLQTTEHRNKEEEGVVVNIHALLNSAAAGGYWSPSWADNFDRNEMSRYPEEVWTGFTAYRNRPQISDGHGWVFRTLFPFEGPGLKFRPGNRLLCLRRFTSLTNAIQVLLS
jgi:hypothetical protein